MQPNMRSSYAPDEVTLLLKDLTGQVEPLPTAERERLIQGGRHYCEMLPIEYRPSAAYLAAYRAALDRFSAPVARAVGDVARRIWAEKHGRPVLVSLARAGTPVGILLHRWLKRRYGVEVPHYSVSIIRGRGIDENALRYLLARHPAESLQFVDGWIGKGAILSQLREALTPHPSISPTLAVLADPARLTPLCGTREDLLIPSACLNSTVSGLISRTFLRADLIGPDDFHGAVYYGNLQSDDRTAEFLDRIEASFDLDAPPAPVAPAAAPGDDSGPEEVREIAARFGIADINLIKPGIGEATRVLLRRVPWKLLVQPQARRSPELDHLLRLAAEKGVPTEDYPLRHYRACGLIRKLADN